MLHAKQPDKNTHEYSNVAHELKEDVTHLQEHEEEEESSNDFEAWPTKKPATAKSESPKIQDSPKVTQSTLDSEPSSKEKRPILIGNLDEESLFKKKDVILI